MNRGRKIRRVIVRAGIFLLLGAVLNIVAAWGLALTVSPDQSYGIVGSVNDAYAIEHWRTPGGQRVVVYQIGGMTHCGPGLPPTYDQMIPRWGSDFLQVPRPRHPLYSELVMNTSTWGVRVADARGWPCLTAWGGAHYPRSGIALPAPPAVRGIWTVGSHPSDQKAIPQARLLPYLPLWRGLAVNTLFYSLALWLVVIAWSIPGRVRRRQRNKRGLCLSCGYDLRATPERCPECGVAPAAKVDGMACAMADS